MFRSVWEYGHIREPFVDSVSSADGPGKPVLNSVAMETAESWESLARKDVCDVRVQLGHG